MVELCLFTISVAFNFFSTNMRGFINEYLTNGKIHTDVATDKVDNTETYTVSMQMQNDTVVSNCMIYLQSVKTKNRCTIMVYWKQTRHAPR